MLARSTRESDDGESMLLVQWAHNYIAYGMLKYGYIDRIVMFDVSGDRFRESKKTMHTKWMCCALT
jgi:hypothetical protein